MTMNTQGRPTTPESVSMSSIETVSGSRGLLQAEGLIFEVGTSETTGVDLPAPKGTKNRLGGVTRGKPTVLPGLTAQWNRKWQLQDWPSYPLTRGSYSYWKVGQYTSFAGVESEIEGNCHFCGEHTSIDSQGYLNGAVETGERAAAEVVAAQGK